MFEREGQVLGRRSRRQVGKDTVLDVACVQQERRGLVENKAEARSQALSLAVQALRIGPESEGSAD